MTPRIIVLIPARGGSKRFPGKNIHPFLDKPLIAHPIAAAKAASMVSRVIVSTDSEDIARVAREHGAEVPFMRPSDIAGDTSSVVEAVQFTLRELERTEGYKADYVVLLQPTTPVIEPAQIEAAIRLAIEKNADSVVAVSAVDTINHPYNVRQMQSDGSIRFWQYDLHYNCVGPERPAFYHAANLWLSSYDTVMSGKLEGERTYPLVVPARYAADIDFKEDLERIEAYEASLRAQR